MGEGDDDRGQSGAPGVYSRFQFVMATFRNARTGSMVSGLGALVPLQRKSGEVCDGGRRRRCPGSVAEWSKHQRSFFIASATISVPFSQGRQLACSIPNARFVPLDSENHALISTEPAWMKMMEEMEAFLANGG